MAASNIGWSTEHDSCCLAAKPGDSQYGNNWGCNNGCQSLFCPCFVYGQIVNKLDPAKIPHACCNSCPNAGLLTYFLLNPIPPLTSFLCSPALIYCLRRDMAYSANIREDTNTSCQRSWCCSCCALAQMHREAVLNENLRKKNGDGVFVTQVGAPSRMQMSRAGQKTKRGKRGEDFYSMD